MIKTYRLLIVLLIVGFGFSNATFAEQYFQEKDGLVVVEVESSPLAGGWAKATEQSGYTGTAYYMLNGNSWKGGGVNGILKYKILITNPGTYYFKLRCSRGYPKDWTWANDIYLKMVDHPGVQGNFNKVFGGGKLPGWGWANTYDIHGKGKFPASFELTPGAWELNIAGRSKGFRIDRFVLYNKELTSPSKALDLSLSESQGGIPAIEIVHHTSIKNYLERGYLGRALKEAQAASARIRKKDSDEKSEALTEALKVEEAILKYAQERYDAILKIKKDSPVATTELLTELAKQLSGSQRGAELQAEVQTWRSEPAYKNTLKADQYYAAMEKVAKTLRGKGDFANPKIRQKYAYKLVTVKKYFQALQERYPNTPGYKKAMNLFKELGLPLQE